VAGGDPLRPLWDFADLHGSEQRFRAALAEAPSPERPDGWFHEELAEEYAALGRDEVAREQARLALPLLEEVDPTFAEDGERPARLRRLAGA
jgi:hypothetical protein